ncbi:MAG: hypothetical protein DSZ05_06295 [Sulfurospirillum sp.]|nr:MAG: hypothetical protein DSZ05_06295 [Sulfurospirillum sp.]
MRFLYLYTLLVISLLSGCHSSDTEKSYESGDLNRQAPLKRERIFGAVQPPAVCTLQNRKKFVYDLMHDTYLWADETKDVNYSDDQRYPDEETLMRDLRNPKDRFSFIMDLKTYDDFFEAGKNVGYGIFFEPLAVETNSNGYRVDALALLLVYPGSPADKAGLRRGDRIVAMDNRTIDTIYHDANLFHYYFESSDPVTARFHIERNDGTETEVSVTKAEYDVKSVIKTSVRDFDNRKIGYLLFQSFVGSSEQELKNAFAKLKDEGVDDLVLDLRYNGGGYVYIARELASLIGGWYSSRKIFNQTLFNRKYSDYNMATYFSYYLYEQLSLPRVYIITTGMTCSASELVINSLRASVVGVEVIQIGTPTCGKPYAMIGGPYCDKYILPVQMKNANADGSGDYVDGLQPLCESEDDYLHDFADPQEDSFAQALYYIRYDRCRPLVHSERRQSQKLMTTPVSESFRSRYGLY